MWYVTAKKRPDWSAARRHLSRVDPRLAKIIRRVGRCTIVPRRDYFPFLCVCIFNQQISMKAAEILYGRFRDLFPRRKPTPRRTIELINGDGDILKGCGISRQKRAYLLDLSRRFAAGDIPTRRLARMTDEQVIESLTRIKGIGRWTAEMFLMFVQNRPDVLPVDDLGLREAMKRMFKLRERPTATEMIRLAAPWRPWRSIATWYLWRGLEN
jgi:DNA-3-methyladenine glycosylase II